MKERTFFSTEGMSLEEAYTTWSALFRPLWIIQPDNSAPCATIGGTFSSSVVGSMIFLQAKFSNQLNQRNSRVIAQSGLDHYMINCYEAGNFTGIFGDREFSGGPGDIRILDMARPFSKKVSTGSIVSVIVPRLMLAEIIGNRDVHGHVLKAERPLTAVLRSLIHDMAKSDFKAGWHQITMLENVLQDLFRAILLGEMEAAEYLRCGARAIRDRIIRFIEANLFDPELGVEMLVREFRLSRAHIYRILESKGGIAALIRRRRLDSAYRALLKAEVRGDHSVKRVAYEHGFSSVNHFFRAFKLQYGITPTEAMGMRGEASGLSTAALALHTHFLRGS